ncbi:nucleoside triphosphate pyrophosphohydrolase [Natronoarchaeum rubrum]|uniref:nucleoside triphosphate pyrophosphohydrolase n=1 Tax=Natronoarchaeum rubrum TaxID=755311 RepID=UPI0021120445|nr:nucleoside triphosphate pyrophosphohydrolase [Natronoarchaeum rubrum]
MAPSDDGETTRREYHKLVRDDIPEIVHENDETPITHVADDEEYAELLGEKLVEEACEFRESGDLEELADVLAVVDAVRERRNVVEDELRELQAEKAAERGRFAERIVLDAVEK